jgi:hypothetical protein
MLLGDILRRFSDEPQAAAALLSLGDLVLIGQVEVLRIEHHESVGEYVSGATRRFAGQASDSDWLRLTTALEGSIAPAATCLQTMVAWAVERDRSGTTEPGGCSCK